MKKFYFLFILPFFLWTCNTASNKAEVQNFYYEFIGFDSSEKLGELLQLVSNEYEFNDYLITSNDELIAFPRGSSISRDSLHKFHPVIHRIEAIENKEALKKDDVLIQVAVVPASGNALPSFSYKRFTMNAEKSLQLEFDFGVHPLIGVSTSEFLLRWSFIAEEFARASFK